MFERIIERTISHPSREDILDAYDEALVEYFQKNNMSYSLENCKPLTRSFSYRTNIFKAWIDEYRILKIFKEVDKRFI